MKTHYMDKKTTLAIKGIMLVFMFIHHFFTIPSWYVEGISYPLLANLAPVFREPLRICVPVFAFLTGYNYAFNQNKTYRYSLRKITDLLFSYWIVYIPLLAIAILLGCYKFNLTAVALEMFAISTPVMCFCWYVSFYCMTMLLLPILAKLVTGSALRDAFVLLILPTIAFELYTAAVAGTPFAASLNKLMLWFPCVTAGYLVAQHSLFESWFDKILANFRSRIAKCLFLLIIALIAFFGRTVFPDFELCRLTIFSGQSAALRINMDILYAPLLVYSLVKLFRAAKPVFLKPFIVIGESSMLMWFIHSIFFNVANEKTQRILYWPRNPLLVLLFGLIICLLAARLVNLPLKPLLKFKNRLVFDRKSK